MLDAFVASRRHSEGKISPQMLVARPTTSPGLSESLIQPYAPASVDASSPVGYHYSVSSRGDARKSLAAYLDTDSHYTFLPEHETPRTPHHRDVVESLPTSPSSDSDHDADDESLRNDKKSLRKSKEERARQQAAPRAGFLASVWALGFARERRNTYAASIASSHDGADDDDDYLEDPERLKGNQEGAEMADDELEFPEYARVPEEIENMPLVDEREFALRYRSQSKRDLRDLARPELKRTGSVTSLSQADFEARQENIKAMLEEAKQIVQELKAKTPPIEAVGATGSPLKSADAVSQKSISVDDDDESAKLEADSPRVSLDDRSSIRTSPRPVDHMPEVAEAEIETDDERKRRPVLTVPAAIESASVIEAETVTPSVLTVDEEAEAEKKKEKSAAQRMAKGFRRRMSVTAAISPFKKPKDAAPGTPTSELTPPVTPPADQPTTPKLRNPFNRARRGSISAADVLSSHEPAERPQLKKRHSIRSIASSVISNDHADAPPKKPLFRRPTLSSSDRPTFDKTERRKSWFGLPKPDSDTAATTTAEPTPTTSRPPSLSGAEHSDAPRRRRNSIFRRPTMSTPTRPDPATLLPSRPASIDTSSALELTDTAEKKNPEHHNSSGGESKRSGLKRMGFGGGRSQSDGVIPPKDNNPKEKKKDAAAKMKGFMRANTFMGRARKDKGKEPASTPA